MASPVGGSMLRRDWRDASLRNGREDVLKLDLDGIEWVGEQLLKTFSRVGFTGVIRLDRTDKRSSPHPDSGIRLRGEVTANSQTWRWFRTQRGMDQRGLTHPHTSARRPAIRRATRAGRRQRA